MGKGCKRKTRWTTLDIGAPPGEKDEEDGKRTDSAGSTTSDYPSDYASAVSRSRRGDSGGSLAKPKLLFNEEEYTRITTPRQDVLFKKSYLSRKKTWASTASMSATPSTTESQSASHSTADGSETTEDHHLLDCRENGAEEYPAMMEHAPQVAYGTFYDHTSGYYYEYPVMVVGPAPVLPGQSPMHNVLTDVPCGPVPLRPIEWVNPAFMPKHGNEQYCVVDYQTAQLGQYPTLVDEKGVPLTTQTDVTNGSDEAYYENGTESASWAGSVADEEQSGDVVEQSQNGTTESSTTELEKIAEASVNNESFLETALAQQLHVSHVAVPPMPEPYVYPGYYMFGPSLMNVNGVTIQSGPMVRDAGEAWGGTYNRAYAKRKKKKKLIRKTSAQSRVPDDTEQEKQNEEQCSYEAEPVAEEDQLGSINEAGPAGNATIEQIVEGSCSTPSHGRPLDPECREFRPIFGRRPVVKSNEARSLSETIGNHETSAISTSSVERTEVEERIESSSETEEPSVPRSSDEKDRRETENTRTIRETTPRSLSTSEIGSTEELGSKKSEEIVAAPVDFASEVFANVSIMAERARGVVDGTPMETEIGLEATFVNFQEIENSRANVTSSRQSEDASIDRRRNEDCIKQRNVPNGVEERRSSCERTPTSESPTAPLAVASLTTSESRQRSTTTNDKRGSRSASPGMINRTTTPINANSQRLPDSYESLVTRGCVASSLPCVGTVGTLQQSRNRKYSAKGPKFVREATPGPDLDGLQSQIVSVKTVDGKTLRNNKSENGDGETVMRILRGEMADEGSDGEIVHTGIEALEGETERYNMETTDGSSGGFNRADASNEDSGVESQTRLSLEHPIIDAVTEWLQSSNSEKIFVTSNLGSDYEPEDDELENEEPPKNLQGNPIPALSAKNSDVNNDELSRTADFGKFANVKMDEEEVNATRRNDTTSATPRRKRRGNGDKRGGRKNVKKMTPSVITSAMVDVDAEPVRQRLSENNENDATSEKKRVVDVCEITESDSVAGMRVAKSSRTKRNMASTMMEGCKNRAMAEQTRSTAACDRSKRKKKKVVGSTDREVPVENVEVKVRRTTGEELNDEGIVEDEEVSVRTFEKGQIVVSIEGKVLPIDNYEPPILLRNNEPATKEIETIDDGPKFSMTTCEKSRMAETNEEETSGSGSVSKRNSLGSIEEPDVLECWEVETVEPVTTPKKIQDRGTSHEGEAAEDDLETSSKIDPAGMEIVRKYYRLEATRDSGTSVTSVEDNNVDDPTDVTTLKTPNQMIESICSVDIPVLNERMNNLFDRSGIPIDEALEVYESCYVGKRPPSYLIGNEAKFRNGAILYGRDREGAVPCRANCCNIQ